MGTADTLLHGLERPVSDAQAVFRLALHAMSRPGDVVTLDVPAPPVALMPATALLLLALTDHETPVWWPPQDAGATLAAWLRFHTGAPAAADPVQAAFVVAMHTHQVPALEDLQAGTDEAPERGCTLLRQVDSLQDGPCTQWSGPGIRTPRPVRVGGLAPAFWSRWADNHARFPCGVDAFFIHGRQLVGLPRTTLVTCPEPT